jgi:uncharacterized protein (DUF983 family)
MNQVSSRVQNLRRALGLRCPRCGRGRLFRTFFGMHAACGSCGLTFTREPGFYLGSIYINYGVTVIVTGGLYALLVLGIGLTHELALAACLVVAVALPILFFRHARSLLLALDSSVNRHQSRLDRDADAPGGAADGGLNAAHLESLQSDDASAGCLMGAVLALIILFGLGMAAVTIYFSDAGMPPAGSAPADEVDLR